MHGQKITNSYVCKHVIERYLCLKWVKKKLKKKDILIVFCWLI